MNQKDLIQNLEKNGELILKLFTDISEEDAQWKPAPEKWSLLEILNHLCDEEREDFRQRLKLVLENPEKDWPPIDPQSWVSVRGYKDRKLGKSLDVFRNERAASLEWLKSLTSPPWSNERKHPNFGAIKAGDLLASWVAHDLRHIGQISNTLLAFVSENIHPYSTRYAGP
jgi:uncharacterized damage-inducible protein DinB